MLHGRKAPPVHNPSAPPPPPPKKKKEKKNNNFDIVHLFEKLRNGEINLR